MSRDFEKWQRYSSRAARKAYRIYDEATRPAGAGRKEESMRSGQFHWSNNPVRLYRDTKHARIAGVCAGLEAFFDIKVRYVRLAVILMTIFSGWVPGLLIYVALALLLKPMPDNLFKSAEEERFWRTVSVSPNLSVSELRTRFRTLDRRLAEMEARVTSDEFHLRQKFRDLNA
jgi:phage shock protein C